MTVGNDVAWAAGLFEGEGTISYSRDQYPKLGIEMTDYDVLCRFQSVVGGCLYGPYTRTTQNFLAKPKSGAYKPIWSWKLNGVAEICKCLDAFYPYLGERRRATAHRVIDAYYQSDKPRIPARRNGKAIFPCLISDPLNQRPKEGCGSNYSR